MCTPLAGGCLRQISGAMSAQNRHAQKCDKGVAPEVISRTIQASEELPRVGVLPLKDSPPSDPSPEYDSEMGAT